MNDYHFIWEGRVHRVGASAGITLIDDNNHQAAEVMSQPISPVMPPKMVAGAG